MYCTVLTASQRQGQQATLHPSLYVLHGVDCFTKTGIAGHRDASPRMTYDTLVTLRSLAVCRARLTISGVMSTPMTDPVAPTRRAVNASGPVR